jgi:hypothetical protein
MENELEVLLAERAIRRVIDTYARGADRFELELIRECYWPEGTDDHGAYSGGLDGFIEYVDHALSRFESTMHTMCNCLIDVDLHNNLARAETYCLASHRVPADTSVGKPSVDWTCGLRYVDRFERRGNDWRIARRVCAYEWARIDEVDEQSGFGRRFLRGSQGPDDIVWHILDS